MHAEGRTSILNGCRRGFRASSSCGCCTNAVEEDWISGVFARSSLDSAAYHTTSRCSNVKLLRTLFDPFVMPRTRHLRVVCHMYLLVASFTVQNVLSTGEAWLSDETCVEMHLEKSDSPSSPFTLRELICPATRTHHTSATCSGSMTTPCNSRVAINNVRTSASTNLVAFSIMPADAETYFGGACAIILTPNRSFSSRITAPRNARIVGSLSDLTVNLRCPSLFNALTSSPLHCAGMSQIDHAWLDFHYQHNRVSPVVISTVASRCLFLKNLRSSCMSQGHRSVLAVVCGRQTALRHQHTHATNPARDNDRMSRVKLPHDPMDSVAAFCALTGLVSLPLRHRQRGFSSLSRLRPFQSTIPIISRMALQVNTVPLKNCVFCGPVIICLITRGGALMRLTFVFVLNVVQHA